MEPGTGDARRPSNVLTTIVGVVGTVAGVTFVLYLVGVLFEFRRLKTLGLPTDQAVSSMPHDLLIVIGARSLLVPLGVALTVAAADRLATSASPRTMRRTHAKDWLPFAALAVLAVLAVAFVAESAGRVFWEHLGLVVGALVLLGLLRMQGLNRRLPARRALTVFCAVLTASVVVGYAHAMHTPVHFDKATVVLTRGPPRHGFYIGRDSNEIFFVPRAADDTTTCPVLEFISAAEVKRIELQRGAATTGGVERGGTCIKPAP